MDVTDRPSAGRTAAGWAIIAVILLLVVLFLVLPFVNQLTLSFQKWNFLGGAPQAAGFGNYERLLRDDMFGAALQNSLLSPGLWFRAIFLTGAALALALLLMELRNGGRVVVQALLAFLILFSGALVAAHVYLIHYSPMEGLAGVLSAGAGGERPAFFGDPERAVGIIGDLFLAVGLALAVPLGTAFFLAAGRGARALGDGTRFPFGGFWSRAWRLIAAGGVGAIGFSLVSLQAGLAVYPLPANRGENLLTYVWKTAFIQGRFGEGMAAAQFLVWPLAALGIACALLLEAGRSRISIAIVPPLKAAVASGGRWHAGRAVTIAAAGSAAVALLVALAAVIVLPWIGSIYAFSVPFGEIRGDLLAGATRALGNSIASSLFYAIVCWTFAALGGFAFGYLRPRGSRWLLVVLGAFLFIGPTVLFLPQFLMMRDLRLLGSPLALVVPGMASPAGILLFTWFFRGARDERTAAGGLSAGRIWGRFFLFSVPVVAVFMLLSLNSVIPPLALLNEPDTFPISLFLKQMRGSSMPLLPRSQALLAQLAYLQYALPLALLVTSAIAVFPRLALIVRRKGEEGRALNGDPATTPEKE